MAPSISGLFLIDAQAYHHVKTLVHELLDHAGGARGIVGRVAIDQDIDIGIDVGEHSPHHMALALTAFAAHLGAGFTGDGGGAVP